MTVQIQARETDQQLVVRVQKGDKRAFDLLVLKYQHKIKAIVGRYIRDHAEVDDVTQEAFIKAYRALANFRGDSAFYTWMYRIGINTAKNHLVSRGRRPPARDVDIDDVKNKATDALNLAQLMNQVVVEHKDSNNNNFTIQFKESIIGLAKQVLDQAKIEQRSSKENASSSSAPVFKLFGSSVNHFSYDTITLPSGIDKKYNIAVRLKCSKHDLNKDNIRNKILLSIRRLGIQMENIAITSSAISPKQMEVLISIIHTQENTMRKVMHILQRKLASIESAKAATGIDSLEYNANSWIVPTNLGDVVTNFIKQHYDCFQYQYSYNNEEQLALPSDGVIDGVPLLPSRLDGNDDQSKELLKDKRFQPYNKCYKDLIEQPIAGLVNEPLGLQIFLRVDTGTRPGFGGLDTHLPLQNPEQISIQELKKKMILPDGSIGSIRLMHEMWTDTDYMRSKAKSEDLKDKANEQSRLENIEEKLDLLSERHGNPYWFQNELDYLNGIKDSYNADGRKEPPNEPPGPREYTWLQNEDRRPDLKKSGFTDLFPLERMHGNKTHNADTKNLAQRSRDEYQDWLLSSKTIEEQMQYTIQDPDGSGVDSDPDGSDVDSDSDFAKQIEMELSSKAAAAVYGKCAIKGSDESKLSSFEMAEGNTGTNAPGKKAQSGKEGRTVHPYKDSGKKSRVSNKKSGSAGPSKDVEMGEGGDEQLACDDAGNNLFPAFMPLYLTFFDFNDFECARRRCDEDFSRLMKENPYYYRWADRFFYNEDTNTLDEGYQYVNKEGEIILQTYIPFHKEPGKQRTLGSEETGDGTKYPGKDYAYCIRPRERYLESWTRDRNDFGGPKYNGKDTQQNLEDRINAWSKAYTNRQNMMNRLKNSIDYENKLQSAFDTAEVISKQLTWFYLMHKARVQSDDTYPDYTGKTSTKYNGGMPIVHYEKGVDAWTHANSLPMIMFASQIVSAVQHLTDAVNLIHATWKSLAEEKASKVKDPDLVPFVYVDEPNNFPKLHLLYSSNRSDLPTLSFDKALDYFSQLVAYTLHVFDRYEPQDFIIGEDGEFEIRDAPHTIPEKKHMEWTEQFEQIHEVNASTCLRTRIREAQVGLTLFFEAELYHLKDTSKQMDKIIIPSILLRKYTDIPLKHTKKFNMYILTLESFMASNMDTSNFSRFAPQFLIELDHSFSIAEDSLLRNWRLPSDILPGWPEGIPRTKHERLKDARLFRDALMMINKNITYIYKLYQIREGKRTGHEVAIEKRNEFPVLQEQFEIDIDGKKESIIHMDYMVNISDGTIKAIARYSRDIEIKTTTMEKNRSQLLAMVSTSGTKEFIESTKTTPDLLSELMRLDSAKTQTYTAMKQGYENDERHMNKLRTILSELKKADKSIRSAYQSAIDKDGNLSADRLQQLKDVYANDEWDALNSFSDEYINSPFGGKSISRKFKFVNDYYILQRLGNGHDSKMQQKNFLFDGQELFGWKGAYRKYVMDELKPFIQGLRSKSEIEDDLKMTSIMKWFDDPGLNNPTNYFDYLQDDPVSTGWPRDAGDAESKRDAESKTSKRPPGARNAKKANIREVISRVANKKGDTDLLAVAGQDPEVNAAEDIDNDDGVGGLDDFDTGGRYAGNGTEVVEFVTSGHYRLLYYDQESIKKILPNYSWMYFIEFNPNMEYTDEHAVFTSDASMHSKEIRKYLYKYYIEYEYDELWAVCYTNRASGVPNNWLANLQARDQQKTSQDVIVFVKSESLPNLAACGISTTSSLANTESTTSSIEPGIDQDGDSEMPQEKEE